MNDHTETSTVPTDGAESELDDDAVVIDAEVVESDADDAGATEAIDVEIEGIDDGVGSVAAGGTNPGESGDAPGTFDDGSVGAFDAVARERDEYLDALRQLQADFENFRKQAQRRQGDAIDHATGRLVEQLLPVLDACDAGIEHGDEGVTAIFTALLGVLQRVGLERIDPLDEPFDPNAHEAVMHEPADGDDDAEDGPIVTEVMRPGYRWKERILRAAMVKVRG